MLSLSHRRFTKRCDGYRFGRDIIDGKFETFVACKIFASNAWLGDEIDVKYVRNVREDGCEHYQYLGCLADWIYVHVVQDVR